MADRIVAVLLGVLLAGVFWLCGFPVPHLQAAMFVVGFVNGAALARAEVTRGLPSKAKEK